VRLGAAVLAGMGKCTIQRCFPRFGHNMENAGAACLEESGKMHLHRAPPTLQAPASLIPSGIREGPLSAQSLRTWCQAGMSWRAELTQPVGGLAVERSQQLLPQLPCAIWAGPVEGEPQARRRWDSGRASARERHGEEPVAGS
jgi:hypothetical protein